MKMRPTVLAALVLAFSVASSQPALASDDPSRESVVVSGQGMVSGRPDRLDANFGVEVSAATVGDALKNANAAGTRMRDSLVKGGVTKADLQTSSVNINSTRKDDGTITGYTVTQGLTAKIRKLARGGELISAAVTAGGNAARLNGVSFAIDDDAALLSEARKKAFTDARAKATLYAREAGRPLARVVKVTESNPTYWGSAGQDRFATADSPVPLEPGRQQLTVTVTVEWALGPQPAA